MSEFQLKKTSIKDTRIIDTNVQQKDLLPGEVRVKMDKFALTANNITYAIVAEQIGYWQFFPPHSSDTSGTEHDMKGWGILPVWGFADVEASNCDEVPVGERLFGYFPPAEHLILTPSNVGATSWVDASVHRSKLPPAYNVYRKVESEPGYDKSFEDNRMLLYPLHLTSFVLFDYFKEQNWFGATQLVMLSASSKTSTGLAYGVQMLRKTDKSAPLQIALTSTRNIDTVDRMGVYDEVLSYEQISEIDNSKATLIVDMSGNGAVLSALHKHLGDNMKFCSNVGVTHHAELDNKADIIKERSEFFFAPSRIQKRLQDWGGKVFEQKSRDYLSMSISKSCSWLKMTDIDGLTGMSDIFNDVCDGKIPPEAGLIVKMKQ